MEHVSTGEGIVLSEVVEESFLIAQIKVIG